MSLLNPQTTLVDTLRKRVRAAQKEKFSLRAEILRLRQEREQVGLRMDAVCLRHKADSHDALSRLALSTTLYDIDLAGDRGRGAAPPRPAQLKAAELENLEYSISRVAAQASSIKGGGMLRQMREFISFLERAFAALDSKISGSREW